jgi:tRNA-2-methylthio-N6-dimethylallyladenosine synthase
MRRGYTRDEYLRIVEKLRKSRPDIVLSTDLIVGFPLETDEDFMETLSLVQEVGYESAFSFKYSKRPFTEAAKIQPQVTEELKEQRLSVLQSCLNQFHQGRVKRYIGSVQEVLVEKPSKKRKDDLMGRTPTNHAVVFPGDSSLIGTIVPVKITEVAHHTLLGHYHG